LKTGVDAKDWKKMALKKDIKQIDISLDKVEDMMD